MENRSICERVECFIQRYSRLVSLMMTVILILALLGLKFVASISDLLILFIVGIVIYFFLLDVIQTYIIKPADQKKSKIENGVKIILGDWGCGKTHYFNNVYISDYKDQFEIVRLSCFSYSRDEFIKQIVAINFWNRWLSLNGILAGYISFNWHKMLPKNKLIFIDDLERLPCDENMANDFIGIIEKLKSDNQIVIACSHNDIRQEVIRKYLEKLVDELPIEITLDTQILSNAIVKTIQSAITDIGDKKNELRASVDNLVGQLRDEKVQRKFSGLFTGNSDDFPVNLRNIKKVLCHIYRQDNAAAIINQVTALITTVSNEINIDNIKSVYSYLKTSEIIKEYLISYELLFAYPNLKAIIEAYDEELYITKVNDDGKINKLRSIMMGDKDWLAFKKYIQDKIKPNHVNKIKTLYNLIGLGGLQSLSFSSIKISLDEINTLSNVTDDELLSLLILSDDNHAIEIEKYFTNDKKYSQDVFKLCKRVALYVIAKKIDNNITSSPYNIVPLELFNRIENGIDFLEKSKEFWGVIGDLFIKNTSEDLKEKCRELVGQTNDTWWNHFKGIRLLTFLAFLHKSKSEYSFEFDQGQSGNWLHGLQKEIENRKKQSDYFDYVGSERYLFDIHAKQPNPELLGRLRSNIKVMNERFKQDNQELHEQEVMQPVNMRDDDPEVKEIKTDFESLFSSDPLDCFR